MLLAALSNKAGPARDILALNAGAAIYVAGLADSHQAGVQKALEVLAIGAAKAKLDQFVAFTQKLRTASAQTAEGAEDAEKSVGENEIGEISLGCAIRVHSAFGGPGLLESTYEVCLVHELSKAGIRADRQVASARGL